MSEGAFHINHINVGPWRAISRAWERARCRLSSSLRLPPGPAFNSARDVRANQTARDDIKVSIFILIVSKALWMGRCLNTISCVGISVLTPLAFNITVYMSMGNLQN